MSNTAKSILVTLVIAATTIAVVFGIYRKKQVDQLIVPITEKARELTEKERLDILNRISEKDILEESGRVLDAVNQLSKESPSSNLTDEQKQKILESLSQ